MLDRLVILHSRDPKSLSEFEKSDRPGAWVSWNTCLRSIWIGMMDSTIDVFSFSPAVEVYQGVDAYRFCLEVVSGLHSPLIGETEVMGQFKEVAKTVEAMDEGSENQDLKRLFRNVLSDAKAIRHQWLLNLGSQSYGSLARKFLKRSRSIHVMGAGQLVEELLPWLKDFQSVEVFCRDIKKREHLAVKHKNTRLVSLDSSHHDGTEGSALIIAAPIESKKILEWIAHHGHDFMTILDLRGEAKADPIVEFSGEVISLGEFFSSVKKNQESIQKIVDQAKADIRHRSQERSKTVELRPFGWDDLCA